MTVPDTLPPELAELGELLREDPPRPGEDWTRRLDERVAAGFPGLPRAVQRARRERRSRWFTALRPAMAPVAVVLVLAVAIGVPTLLDAGSNGEFMSGTAEETSGSASGGGEGGGAGASAEPDAFTGRAKRDQSATPAAGGAEPLPIPPGAGGGSASSDTRRARRVERSAALTLGAPAREIDDVADGVVRVTDSLGGFVRNSSVYSGRASESYATFELRIPTARLQRALAELSRLAHVRERSQASRDITAQAVSAADRLQEARRERQSLLRQLGRAVTINETESIKERLRLVNRRIAAARAAVERVSNRASFANVSVTLLADSKAGVAPDDGSWTPGDAFRDAVRVLEVAAGVFLIALALLIPLGLVAVFGWLGARVAVRRRRERALDVA